MYVTTKLLQLRNDLSKRNPHLGVVRTAVYKTQLRN